MTSFKQKRMQLLNQINELNIEFCEQCTEIGGAPSKCNGCVTYEKIREIGLALDIVVGERKRVKIAKEKQLQKQMEEAEQKRRNREMAFTMDPVEFVELKMKAMENGKLRTMEEVAEIKGVSVGTLYDWRKKNASVVKTAIAALGLNETDKKEEKKRTIPIQKIEEAGAPVLKEKTDKTVVNSEIHDKLQREYDELSENQEKLKDRYQEVLEENKELKGKADGISILLTEENEKLKREIIDAHKLVTEWQERHDELKGFNNMAKSMYEDLNENYEQEQQNTAELQKLLEEADAELQHTRALLRMYLGKNISIA